MEKIKITEIVGGGFNNKGAELMLSACCQALNHEAFCKLAIDWRIGNYGQRAEYKLLHKINIYKLKRWGNIPIDILPAEKKQRLGIVSASEIDIMLDISGFAYSDQWPIGRTEMMLKRIQWQQSKGLRYFLLPQAYGPFKRNNMRSLCKQYFDSADILYVRDRLSLEYMVELMGDGDDRVKLCPDFTCLVDPIAPMESPSQDYVCIVPNFKMLDPQHGNFGEPYMDLLLRAIEQCHEKGFEVVLVNHEGQEDLDILVELQKRSKHKTKIIRGGGPRELKGVFTNARFVIASRFHALVSSITQGVPVIGTGWSHKYKELFADFGIEEYLVSVDGEVDVMSDLISHLSDPKNCDSVRCKIQIGAEAYKNASLHMWKDIKSMMMR